MGDWICLHAIYLKIFKIDISQTREISCTMSWRVQPWMPRGEWIVDAYRDGKRFIVRTDEKLAAFMELEAAIRAR